MHWSRSCRHKPQESSRGECRECLGGCSKSAGVFVDSERLTHVRKHGLIPRRSHTSITNGICQIIARCCPGRKLGPRGRRPRGRCHLHQKYPDQCVWSNIPPKRCVRRQRRCARDARRGYSQRIRVLVSRKCCSRRARWCHINRTGFICEFDSVPTVWQPCRGQILEWGLHYLHHRRGRCCQFSGLRRGRCCQSKGKCKTKCF